MDYLMTLMYLVSIGLTIFIGFRYERSNSTKKAAPKKSLKKTKED
jgi:hypothetical protein